MTDIKLAGHFWLSEFLRSETATRKFIDNTPDAQALSSLRKLLAPGLQRVRELLGQPVQITSGYRSPELNAAIGGSRKSQHCEGLAADFVSPSFGAPRLVASTIAANAQAIDFDQLIFEGQWGHISFSSTPRREVLTAHFSGGTVLYTKGIA